MKTERRERKLGMNNWKLLQEFSINLNVAKIVTNKKDESTNFGQHENSKWKTNLNLNKSISNIPQNIECNSNYFNFKLIWFVQPIILPNFTLYHLSFCSRISHSVPLDGTAIK